MGKKFAAGLRTNTTASPSGKVLERFRGDGPSKHPGYDVKLPGQLDQYGEASVLAALVCFESTGSLEFAGRDAELAEELLRCALVRATVSARFLMTDGELRLRLQSQGLSVAGEWTKRVLESSTGAQGMGSPS